MPDDRFALSYELIFLLVKSDRYHFDRDTFRHLLDRPSAEHDHNAAAEQDRKGLARHSGRQHNRRHADQDGSGMSCRGSSNCRDRRRAARQPLKRQEPETLPLEPIGDVWSLPARPQRHTLPIEVPLACIAAGCRPGGTVLDMFAADGTTGIAARQLGRSFTGMEQRQELSRAAKRRLREADGREHDETQ
ncbi:DNA methyltransferase [Spirillospora sp. CA-128828]|uniref:DNA methyltransferase n=1 Tax=Spirillospora sp. CA-128828 TaxID=3240033 RepID=UPI003D8B6B00